MSWQVSQKTLKSGEKRYRLWTTVSDRWLTPWSKREQIIRYMVEDAFYRYKKEIIEMYHQFPHHYGDKDSKKVAIILDEDGKNRWKEWNMRYVNSLFDKEPYDGTVVDKEFEKIMKELDL